MGHGFVYDRVHPVVLAHSLAFFSELSRFSMWDNATQSSYLKSRHPKFFAVLLLYLHSGLVY